MPTSIFHMHEKRRTPDYRTPLGETSLRPSRDKPLRPLREIETKNVTYEVLYNVLLGWVHAKNAKKNC